MTGKLVRDRIPEIIRASGREPVTRILDDAEFETALRHKLLEEATEAAAAPATELLEELADVLEVVRALASLDGQDLASVLAAAEAKLQERGGFSARVFLEDPSAGATPS